MTAAGGNHNGIVARPSTGDPETTPGGEKIADCINAAPDSDADGGPARRKEIQPTRIRRRRLAAQAFISAKEKNDFLLALKIQKDNIITTASAPFKASDTKEVNNLLARGVFNFEGYNKAIHSGIQIFDSRMMRKIKDKTTIPYEKSRLIIQGYTDKGKLEILTQSPTIQRASQCLIIALIPLLMKLGHIVYLRDITQAYPQS